MQINLRRCWTALLISGCALASPARLPAQEPWLPGGIEVLGDGLEFQQDSPVRLASQVERSTQPLDSPLQPLDSPLQPLDSPPLVGSDTRSLSLGGLPAALQQALALDSQPAVDVVTGGQAATLSATDLGSVLQESDNVQTVNTQRRSQVGFDPHVRGYKFGQIYTQSDGQYFLPVRQDLDTMLNKVDPSLIQTMTVIPGPYGLRFGPGFSYIDIVTIETPRSDCGFQWNNRFGVSARSNGGQIYGRDTVLGGAENYGFIAHFDIKSGSDYQAGNGQKIPSSYHNQNALLQLGFDLSDAARIEVGYSRLDIRDTEYALQFFDVSALQTDSFNLRYVQDDFCTGGVTVGQVWYNQTHFAGDNLNASKFEIRQRVANGLSDDFPNGPDFTANDFRAFTNGNLTSLGARAYRLIGEETGENFRAGADFRQITQTTYERFSIRDPSGVPGTGGTLTPFEEVFSTNQPHAVLADPGLFSEWTVPWTSYVKSAVGGRVDWAHTYPRVADYSQRPQLPQTRFGFDQTDLLLAGYGTGEVELTECWTLRGGLGYAERTPDLMNRYADGVFVGVLQNGFSRIVGLPTLQKERATQADVSAVADYGWISGRASYFYSWINDYNTYASIAFDPTGAQVLLAQNTDQATLTGFEWNVDYVVDEITTLFVNMMYVEGADREINRPLPQIYPLQSRAGLRWEDPSDDNIWGFEWGFRFVARQDRIGFLRDSIDDITSRSVETVTPGFATSYVRGYYNLSERLHLIGGIDNLFDRTYLEHLDLRLPGPPVTPGGVTAVLSPGFNAYAGLEWEI